MEHGFRGSRVVFVILGEAPLEHEPAEAPLDGPALGKHLEALARRTASSTYPSVSLAQPIRPVL